jgi:hypothetical protein
MKMKWMKITMMFCAAISLALPCTARATTVDTVDIVNTGYGANDIVNVWGGDLAGEGVYTGVYMLDKTDGAGEGSIWPNGPIGGFCIELHEPAQDESLTYDVVMPEEVYNSYLGQAIGAEKADYLRELWGRHFDPDWVGDGPFSSQQDSDAAAFATAVWEIIYEDLPQSPLEWDVTIDSTPCSGGFYAKNVDATTANSWLHSLTGCGPKADLRAFVYDGAQDYLVQVPEPATIALFGIGGVLSLLRKRKIAQI